MIDINQFIWKFYNGWLERTLVHTALYYIYWHFMHFTVLKYTALQYTVLLATRYLAKVLQKKAEYRFLRQTTAKIFFENATGNLVHLLNVCHLGRFSLSFPHSTRFHGIVCPSNLGEYSLVRLLFFQNLHWVFWVWIAMFLGTRRYFWQHSCFRKLQFLLYNQFLPIFKL